MTRIQDPRPCETPDGGRATSTCEHAQRGTHGVFLGLLGSVLFGLTGLLAGAEPAAPGIRASGGLNLQITAERSAPSGSLSAAFGSRAAIAFNLYSGSAKPFTSVILVAPGGATHAAVIDASGLMARLSTRDLVGTDACPPATLETKVPAGIWTAQATYFDSAPDSASEDIDWSKWPAFPQLTSPAPFSAGVPRDGAGAVTIAFNGTVEQLSLSPSNGGSRIRSEASQIVSGMSEAMATTEANQDYVVRLEDVASSGSTTYRSISEDLITTAAALPTFSAGSDDLSGSLFGQIPLSGGTIPWNSTTSTTASLLVTSESIALAGTGTAVACVRITVQDETTIRSRWLARDDLNRVYLLRSVEYPVAAVLADDTYPAPALVAPAPAEVTADPWFSGEDDRLVVRSTNTFAPLAQLSGAVELSDAFAFGSGRTWYFVPGAGLVEETLLAFGQRASFWRPAAAPTNPVSPGGILFDADTQDEAAAMAASAFGRVDLFDTFNSSGAVSGSTSRACSADTIDGLTCLRTDWFFNGAPAGTVWRALALDGYWYLLAVDEDPGLAGLEIDRRSRPLRQEAAGTLPTGASYPVVEGVAQILGEGLDSPSGIGPSRMIRITTATDLDLDPFIDLFVDAQGALVEKVWRDQYGRMIQGLRLQGTGQITTGGLSGDLQVELTSALDANNDSTEYHAFVADQAGVLRDVGPDNPVAEISYSPSGIGQLVWSGGGMLSGNQRIPMVGALTYTDSDGVFGTYTRWADQGSVRVYTASTTMPPSPRIATFAYPPLDLTVPLGDPAAFTCAVADAMPAPTFQWMVQTAGASDWTALSGAVGNTLAIATTTSEMDQARFLCVATTAAGSASSAAATLTLSATQPVAHLNVIQATATATVDGVIRAVVNQPAPVGGLTLQLDTTYAIDQRQGASDLSSGTSVIRGNTSNSSLRGTAGTLTIPGGATFADLVIPSSSVTTADHPAYRVDVTLLSGSGYLVGSPSVATVQIESTLVPNVALAISAHRLMHGAGQWITQAGFDVIGSAPQGLTIASATISLPNGTARPARISGGGQVFQIDLRDLIGTEVVGEADLATVVPSGVYTATILYGNGRSGVGSGSFFLSVFPAFPSGVLPADGGTGVLIDQGAVTVAWDANTADSLDLVPIGGSDSNRAGTKLILDPAAGSVTVAVASAQAYRLRLVRTSGAQTSVVETGFSTGAGLVFDSTSADLSSSPIGGIPDAAVAFTWRDSLGLTTPGSLTQSATSVLPASGSTLIAASLLEMSDGQTTQRVWLARGSDQSVQVVRMTMIPKGLGEVDTGSAWPEPLIPGTAVVGNSWYAVGSDRITLFSTTYTAPWSGFPNTVKLVWDDGMHLYFSPGTGLVERSEADNSGMYRPDGAPQISTQPRDPLLSVGGSTTLAVVASNLTGSASYQWYRNGVSLPGETAPELVVAASSAQSDGTRYQVQITAANGVVSSRQAVLRIVTASAGAGKLSLRLISPPTSLVPGQGVGVLLFQGTPTYQLTSAGGQVLAGSGLANADLDSDGTADPNQVFQVVPRSTGDLVLAARDAAGDSLSVTIAVVAPVSIPLAQQIQPTTTTSPADSTVYSAVCFGQTSLFNQLLALVRANDPTHLRAFAFDAAVQSFVELPTLPSQGYAPSDAVFIATRIDLGLGKLDTAAEAPYPILLRPGWNFVGMPAIHQRDSLIATSHLRSQFELRDPLGDPVDAATMTSVIGAGFYHWDGSAYALTTTMASGQGYFIKNNSSVGTTFQLVRIDDTTAVADVTALTPTVSSRDIPSRTYPVRDRGEPPAPPATSTPADDAGGGCGSGLGLVLVGSFLLLRRRRAA